MTICPSCSHSLRLCMCHHSFYLLKLTWPTHFSPPPFPPHFCICPTLILWLHRGPSALIHPNPPSSWFPVSFDPRQVLNMDLKVRPPPISLTSSLSIVPHFFLSKEAGPLPVLWSASTLPSPRPLPGLLSAHGQLAHPHPPSLLLLLQQVSI